MDQDVEPSSSFPQRLSVSAHALGFVALHISAEAVTHSKSCGRLAKRACARMPAARVTLEKRYKSDLLIAKTDAPNPLGAGKTATSAETCMVLGLPLPVTYRVGVSVLDP